MTSSPTPKTRFSQRTGWNRSPSELQEITSVAKLDGSLLDLTVSNPSACGLGMSASDLLNPLQNLESLQYSPDPKGLLSARESITAYYDSHGAAVSPEQIILTASTSEAYGHLFRLLCEPADEVLIAQLSYPLFHYLADLSDVTLRFYPLFYDHGWWIDTMELERAITPRTRAIVVVHPNNPTGHLTSSQEREYLFALCRRHGLALVVDEVFLDYLHAPATQKHSFAASSSSPLMFILSGLSKIAALPQVKLAWILTLGPEEERQEALERLEIVADTYLSVSTPAQLALPSWLKSAAVVQQDILKRILLNRAMLASDGLEGYEVSAGWSLMLRLPQIFADENAFQTLRHAGILTHPAHFYGLDDPNRVVLSLITPCAVIAEAAQRIASLMHR